MVCRKDRLTSRVSIESTLCAAAASCSALGMIPAAWLLAAITVLITCTLTFRYFNAAQPAVEASSNICTRVITAEEVKQHNRAGDCWLIIKSKVYDVTPYVEEHPGGRAILRHAGGDATKGFFGPQHPDRVFDLIEDFLVGHLDG